MTLTLKTTLFSAALLGTLATSSVTRADTAPTTPSASEQTAPTSAYPPPLVTTPAPAPAPNTVTHPATYAAPQLSTTPLVDPRARRGKFSGKRFIVNSLASGLAGGLIGLAVFKGLGGDNIGAAFAGLGAQIAVTPAVVYGVGKAMGGEGSIGSAYLGGLIAFSGPAGTTDQAAVSFAVGMLLMPFTSALMYEFSSNIRSKRFETLAKGFQIAPTVNGNGVAGVRAGLSFRF